MHLRTRLTLGVATAAAVAGGLVTGVVPAATAATVTPNAQLTIDAASTGANLLNGQTVILNGSGYKPNGTVYITECSNLAAGDSNSCDAADGATNIDKIKIVSADATGNIAGVAFTVHTGPTGTVGGKCDATNPACGIAATDSTDPTAADAHFGAVGITFSKIQGSPLTGLHDGDNVNVTGVALEASTTYAIVQCSAAVDASGNGCDKTRVVVTQSDANGALAAQFPVHTGQLDPNTANSVCSDTQGGCSIQVAKVSDQTVAGGLPIAFAAAPSAVTPKVTASSSKSSVSKGEKFSVKGQATAAGKGVNGLTAVLVMREGSGHKWTVFNSKTTSTVNGKAGSVKFKVKGLKHKEQYQIRTAKKVTSTKVYNKAKSNIVTVK